MCETARDNKQHCHRVITYAWLVLTLIGAARKGEGRENKGNRERVVRDLAENRAFDQRVKNYQLNTRCCWVTASKHYGKCSHSNISLSTSTD